MHKDTARFSTILIAFSLSLLWISCRDSTGRSDDYLHEISALSTSTTALDSLREVISADATDDERLLLLKASLDSSDDVRAAALFVTLLPDKAAAEIISHPSRSVLNRLSEIYCSVGDTAANSAFRASMLQQFNSLSPSEAADFLVAIASPEEIGRGMRPGDEMLEREIALRYNGDEAVRFRQAIKSNSLYNH